MREWSAIKKSSQPNNQLNNHQENQESNVRWVLKNIQVERMEDTTYLSGRMEGQLMVWKRLLCLSPVHHHWVNVWSLRERLLNKQRPTEP